MKKALLIASLIVLVYGISTKDGFFIKYGLIVFILWIMVALISRSIAPKLGLSSGSCDHYLDRLSSKKKES